MRLAGSHGKTDTIGVVDQGRDIRFSFEDMLKYHGPGSPGGVAHAFRVLERAERFVFRVGYRGRAVTLIVREGFVTAEFIVLARQKVRTIAEERHLRDLKLDMAGRVMSAPAEAV